MADGRPWIFVKVETDEGVIGYGECSDGRNPNGVAGTIKDLTPLLIGRDPRAYEMRCLGYDSRGSRQSPGGIAAKAIAGIKLALVDIKAKALGISVVELFGGPTRENVRVYWSHCGSSRVRNFELIGVPPLRTMEDIAALGPRSSRKRFHCPLKRISLFRVTLLLCISAVSVKDLEPPMEM